MKRRIAALLAALLLLAPFGGAAEEEAGLEGMTKEIARFELYRFGEMAYDSYEIVRLPDGYSVSVSGGTAQRLDGQTVRALAAVIEKYALSRWDGFDRSRADVLDGEGFRLEIEFTDGSAIRAFGDNAFPADYFDAMGELQEILDDMRPAPSAATGGKTGFFSGILDLNRGRIVGTDVPFQDITEFYYTYATSTFPPEYQRYRFYAAGDRRLFDHETRVGETFPLTEADTTLSGTVELTEAQWQAFCDLLAGGTVRRRSVSDETGDAGPWLYLYWQGDEGEYQEFAFEPRSRLGEFEAFCEALRDAQGGE